MGVSKWYNYTMKGKRKNKDYTKLQVPLPKTLRDSAQRVAYKQGYSSLQEVVRVFLTSYSKGKFVPEFSQEDEYTQEYVEYIKKRTKEVFGAKSKGELYTAKNADDIIRHAMELTDEE